MGESYADQILIVEDEEKLAQLLKKRLEWVGYSVHTEGRGSAAIKYATQHRPNLVILDLRLPDIDGYEVSRKLRKLFYPLSVPVLILTGMDLPVDQLRGFAHGADAYLTKPYNPGELLRTIALLLADDGLA